MSLVGRKATGWAIRESRTVEAGVQVPRVDRVIVAVGEVIWAGTVLRSGYGDGGGTRSELHVAILPDAGGRAEVVSIAFVEFAPGHPDDGSFEYAEAEMLRWSELAQLRRNKP